MDEELQNIVNTINMLNPSDLKRERGDFQFTDVGGEIEAIINFAKNFKENEDFYNMLPDTEKESLRNELRTASDIFQQIRDFNPSVPNPQEIRNSLAQRTSENYRDIFKRINQLDIYLFKSAGKQAQLSELTRESKRILSDIKNSQKEISRIADTSRKTATNIPLYKYLGIFSEESDKHKKAAYWWLGFTILLTIATVLLLLQVSHEFSNNLKDLDSTQKIYAFLLIKLFYLAIVFYVLQQTTRNYLANMHLCVINKQRENSLKVFEALVQNSDNKEITNQILLYLSQAIFYSTDTGFYPGKDSNKDGPDVVSIVRDIPKGKA